MMHQDHPLWRMNRPNLRLERLDVHGFKMLHRVSFSFNPRFNLVVGTNGCGKSTMLQVFDFVRCFSLGLNYFKWNRDKPDPRSYRTFAQTKKLGMSLTFRGTRGLRLLWQFTWSYVRKRTTWECLKILSSPRLPALTFDWEWVTEPHERFRVWGVPFASVLLQAHPEDWPNGEPYARALNALRNWVDNILVLPDRAGEFSWRPNEEQGEDRIESYLSGRTVAECNGLAGRLGTEFDVQTLTVKPKSTGKEKNSLSELWLTTREGMPRTKGEIGMGLRRFLRCEMAFLRLRQGGTLLIDEISNSLDSRRLAALFRRLRQQRGIQIFAANANPLPALTSARERICLDEMPGVISLPPESTLNLSTEDR